MIESFLHKGLAELFRSGRTTKIDARLHGRISRRLDALDQAVVPEDLNVAGWNFHALRGFDPIRYTIHVNGPWCITFAFDSENAVRVDFEQYH